MRGSALLTCAFVTLAPALAGDPQQIRLIVRGDDLGMSYGSLAAFEKAFNHGVLTSAGIIVPAPWFEAAAELAKRNPGWCTGVHLCLVGEWRGYRWRPVLGWDRVRSLVDEDGYLYGSPDELFAHKPRLEEIDAELRAQINLARKRGINLHYVDLHYVELSQYPGFEALIRKIAADYDLPLSSQLGEKPLAGVYQTPLEQKLPEALRMLQALEPGLWLWVCHLGIDSPEQRALIHSDPRDIFVVGGVGRHRAAETEVLVSLEVRSAILQKGIVLTNYRDLWRERKEKP